METKATVVAASDFATVTMPRKSAEVLKFILFRIGGSHDGPRGDADDILCALDRAGIKMAELKTVSGKDSIYVEGARNGPVN